MSEVNRLITDFIKMPEIYWENNTRQCQKFVKRRNRILKDKMWDEEDLSQFAQVACQRRLEKKIHTIYLPSVGASGSHLVQQILNLAYDVIPLGEIYLPQKLIEVVENLTKKEQNLFMEVYHLIHCSESNKLLKFYPFINTTHKPTLKPFISFSQSYRKSLLVRNPVDITISRTFRKQGFRSYINKASVSDMDYLKENMNRVKTFYKAAYKHKYESIIKFEDVVTAANCGKVERELELLMVGYNKNKSLKLVIEEAVTGQSKTNKYSGGKVEILPEYIDLAISELDSTLLMFQY